MGSRASNVAIGGLRSGRNRFASVTGGTGFASVDSGTGLAGGERAGDGSAGGERAGDGSAGGTSLIGGTVTPRPGRGRGEGSVGQTFTPLPPPEKVKKPKRSFANVGNASGITTSASDSTIAARRARLGATTLLTDPFKTASTAKKTLLGI